MLSLDNEVELTKKVRALHREERPCTVEEDGSTMTFLGTS